MNQNKEIARTIIDVEDIPLIKKYKWYLTPAGYVKSYTFSKHTSLHRLLLNFPDSMGDHIDRNKLNNRKSNLRITDRVGNSRNKTFQTNNTSGVVGVKWHKQHKKWYAYIKAEGREIFLGLFKDIELARKVRVEAEYKYFGEYRSGVNGEIL